MRVVSKFGNFFRSNTVHVQIQSPYLGVNLVARVHGALATDHRLTAGLAQAKNSKKRAKLFAKEQVLQQDLQSISLALSKGQKPTRKPESTTPIPTKSAN